MANNIAAIVLLALASITANLSTERASPHIDGAIGWALTAILLIAGIMVLATDLTVAVAISVGLLYLMIGIALISAMLGYRNRSSGRARARRQDA